MISKDVNKINPLEFFECRELQIPPPHFTYTQVTLRFNLQDTIEKWIKKNLKGRYYVGVAYKLNNDNANVQILEVGFENPKELSLFTLGCPHLKYE